MEGQGGKEWCTASRGSVMPLFVGVSRVYIEDGEERHSNNCWCCYVAARSRSLCITSANHSSIVSVDWSTQKFAWLASVIISQCVSHLMT